MEAKGLGGVVRRLTDHVSRREILRRAAGGGAVVTVAALGGGQTEAQTITPFGATCRGTGEICLRGSQCCSDRCRKGRCDCRRKGSPCTVGRTCCSDRCRVGRCA